MLRSVSGLRRLFYSHRLAHLLWLAAMLVLVFFLIALVLARAAAAAPLVDRGGSPQAQDAVATLVARGLLTGYPDGTFKGDRAITRSELADILARLRALVETGNSGLATRAEAGDLQKTVDALYRQMDELEGRVDGVEQGVQGLQRRTDRVNRPGF
ncbi:MAG TPA: S-layer homology domain-containing protein [Candidatus Nitrosotenuis sp.]|jgi:aminoglycoside phosphotransferase (APT) family kinase protein|nr:S-layer homology domain-containing protein [Candidatus Nitrosotenuis sp.]